jgi:hypothetical protein
MAFLRHMTVNLIKKERSSKTSFRGKQAFWNDDILQLLATVWFDAFALRCSTYE